MRDAGRMIALNVAAGLSLAWMTSNAGMSPQEARLAARHAFGAMERMKERYRDRAGIPCLAGISRDVRFAVRVVAKDRWFSACVVAMLATPDRCERGRIYDAERDPGVSAADPLTFGCVVLLLAGVAFAGSFMPPRRAMRIDRVSALRVD